MSYRYRFTPSLGAAAFPRLWVRRKIPFETNPGLGFSYYDLLNQAGLQNCDPRDTACVASNADKEVAVENLWVSQYESNPNTANQPAPSITVTPNPAGVQAMYDPSNPYSGGNVIIPATITSAPDQPVGAPAINPAAAACGAQPARTSPAGNAAWGQWAACMGLTQPAAPSPPSAPAPVPTPAPAAKAPTTPQGQTIIQSSGVVQPSVPVTVGGFDLSSIPWYVYAGVGALVLFGMGGKK